MPAKRKSAFLQATQEAQQQIQEKETVTPSNSTTVKKQEKISFYLTTDQADKLDDLAHEHKKGTGKRINRNDIVRHLIDRCSIQDLSDI
jgi:hypothetical protein